VAENLKQQKSSSNDRILRPEICKIYGQFDTKKGLIDLSEEEHFIQFICFLASLKFKLHHVFQTPETSTGDRQASCHVFLQILFLFFQYANPKYFYYPLRALSEFCKDQQEEKALSKRLNAESRLYHEQEKASKGDKILIEYTQANV
jgi:hypothetical protein